MAQIAKIAIEAATFAIDKPYDYLVPDGMEVRAGMRVIVPFGRGNRRSEGMVLAVEPGLQDRPLKAVEALLDETPQSLPGADPIGTMDVPAVLLHLL